MAFGGKRQLQAAKQLLIPGARGQHQPVSGISAGTGFDPHFVAARRPVEHGFAEMSLGAGGHGTSEVLAIAGLGVEVSGPRIKHRHEITLQPESGKPLASLAGSQHLVRQSVLPCAPQRSRNHHALRWADHQSANDFHQRLSADAFQLPPQLVRPLNEWDVQRVLKVGLPNDATVAV